MWDFSDYDLKTLLKIKEHLDALIDLGLEQDEIIDEVNEEIKRREDGKDE